MHSEKVPRRSTSLWASEGNTPLPSEAWASPYSPGYIRWGEGVCDSYSQSGKVVQELCVQTRWKQEQALPLGVIKAKPTASPHGATSIAIVEWRVQNARQKCMLASPRARSTADRSRVSGDNQAHERTWEIRSPLTKAKVKTKIFLKMFRVRCDGSVGGRGRSTCFVNTGYEFSPQNPCFKKKKKVWWHRLFILALGTCLKLALFVGL